MGRGRPRGVSLAHGGLPAVAERVQAPLTGHATARRGEVRITDCVVDACCDAQARALPWEQLPQPPAAGIILVVPMPTGSLVIMQPSPSDVRRGVPPFHRSGVDPNVRPAGPFRLPTDGRPEPIGDADA